MRVSIPVRFAGAFITGLAIIWLTAASALAAADRAKVREFLNITGFDVSLDSIRMAAASAPAMLGVDANDFGSQWTRLTEEVFDTDVMRGQAVDILEQILSDDLLEHGNAFYGSDLGKRIVSAENASHMVEDDDVKTEAGEAIFAGLVRIGSNRVDLLKRMTNAVSSADDSLSAWNEIQVRFLMAAAGAGVIELQMDEPDLRAFLKERDSAARLSIQQNALTGAAYTYQAFSDEEVATYTGALEHPDMRRLYEVMNAVQNEVMANRFEALAQAMAGLQPSTEL